VRRQSLRDRWRDWRRLGPPLLKPPHSPGIGLRQTYTITRCKTCGTPLPAETDENNIYITPGTLDTPLGASVRTHLFCASRADWDRDEPDACFFDERPD
jgi:hypothetical protein